MSIAWLSEWLEALREQPRLAVHATEHEALFCIDPGEGPLLAVEWEPQTHALHLYGHPGHARIAPRSGAAQATAGEGDEEDEDEAFDGAFAEPQADAAQETLVLELSADAHEQRQLHVQGGTGLMTLSVKRCVASLDRTAFARLVDDVLADMALWALVSAGEAQGLAPTPHGSRTPGRPPLGATLA